MADGDEAAFDRYSRAEARLEHAGGWMWRDRATAMVRGLGFDDDADLDRQLKTFSGGELTRASLARALAGDPDLLLLDEPTNHLDIESLEWLERTLVSLDTAIVLVAHDRWFLEAVGTAVLELEAGRSRFFPGTWTQWRVEQAAREIALGRQIDKQHAEIARLERFVERFRAKATKAKQAQSRVKRLDKIERIERDPRDREGLKFDFKAPRALGPRRLRADRRARRGRRRSGARAARRRRDPPRARRARVARRPQRRGQDDADRHARGRAAAGGRQALDGPQRQARPPLPARRRARQGAGRRRANKVIEACAVHTGLTPNKARALLGRFLFSGEEAEKPLEGLSGGERRRLSLAILVASGANVLILDEPTNHLDIESREALEDALLAFEGSMMLVSHDRALLEAVGTRTVAIDDGRLRSYEGGWQEYVRVREERRLAERADRGKGAKVPPAVPAAVVVTPPVKTAKSAKSARKRPLAVKAVTGPECASEKLAAATAAALTNGAGNGNGAGMLSKNARRRIRELEREIEQAEEALAALEAELALPAAWSTPEATAQSTQRHAAAKRAVEEAFARWEAASP